MTFYNIKGREKHIKKNEYNGYCSSCILFSLKESLKDRKKYSSTSNIPSKPETRGAFFWDYSGIGIFGIDRYLCSFGSYSVFGMNGISFCLFCSR